MSAKSTIGVGGASVTLIGSVIGITIFILPGVLAASAGPAVIAAYALAGILAIFSCVVAAQVGTVFSVSGAGFVAVGTVLGPSWGFLLVWMILGGVSLSIALLAYGAADYLATVWPHLNHGLVATAIILSVYALKSVPGYAAALRDKGRLRWHISHRTHRRVHRWNYPWSR